jgi:hypothetical protein
MRSFDHESPLRLGWATPTRLLCLPLLFALGLSAQSTSNNIIQNPGKTPYVADVAQLESDGVQAFLAAHNLPGTDAALLYQYGRQDLRDELRAWIFTTLQGIIATPASARTQHQQNVYNWFEAMVYQNELAQYQAAISEYQTFLTNKCTYTLDTDIAKAYSLTYNGSNFCVQNNISNVFLAQPMPGPQYFLAVGLKQSYEAPLLNDPDAPAILGQTQIFNIGDYAYAVVPGAATAALTGALYATEVLAPYALRGYQIAGQLIGAITDALDIAVISAGEAGAAGGIVTVTAAIGIAAGLQNETVDENASGIQAMLAYNSSLTQNCSIDLYTLLTDNTGVGNYKLLSTFTATTLPDVPSTAALPARTEGTDPIWGQNIPNGPTSNVFQYADWTGAGVQAELWGNYVVMTKHSSAGTTTSFGVTMKIAEDSGQCLISGGTAQSCSSLFYSASRIGPNWLITPSMPATGAQPCPANSSTGLSAAGSSLTSCQSFVADDVTQEYPYTLPAPTFYYSSILVPPVFETNGVANFIDGRSQSIVLSASEPNSSYAGQSVVYQLTGGPTPPHFSVNRTSSGLTLSYDGTPDAQLPGTYNFTATATFGNNGTGQAAYVTGVIPLAVTVKPGDAIQVRSNTVSAYVGDTVNYEIQAIGPANPVFQLVGVSLPPGLSFRQSGTTAFITGVPSRPESSSGSIQTNYGATTPLTIDITYRQSPAFSNPNTWTFTDNVPSQFKLTLLSATESDRLATILASSVPFPQGFVSSISTLANAARPLTNAPWLKFQTFNDSALLSGTPPTGTGQVVVYLASVLPNSVPAFQTLTILPSDLPAITGSDVIVAPTPVVVTNDSSVVVVTLPVTNINTASLTALSSVQTSIEGNQLSLTVPNSAAGGLFQVDTYTVGGSCASGQATSATTFSSNLPARSFRPVVMAAANSAKALNSNSASDLVPFHTFNVEIDQPPSIESLVRTYFSEGIPNSFSVVTTGFPEATTVPNSTSSAKPMRLTLTGALPAGVTFTDLSPEGLPTGTGILSGTPTQTGTFAVTIVANNGVGTPATQQFILVVNKAGDVNGDGTVNCADVAIVKAAFGSYQGQASYDPRADLNHDFTVNVLDLAFVAAHLPPGTRCQ